MKKGFSLIEIIAVVAIIGILTSIVVSKMSSAQLQKRHSGTVESIVAHLEKQKADTQAGKDGSNFGVKFNADSIVLFKGTSFNATSPNNNVIKIGSEFVISETITNPTNIIFFSKLYGESNEVATITVSHIEDKVSPQKIVVNKSGAISVVE